MTRRELVAVIKQWRSSSPGYLVDFDVLAEMLEQRFEITEKGGESA